MFINKLKNLINGFKIEQESAGQQIKEIISKLNNIDAVLEKKLMSEDVYDSIKILLDEKQNAINEHLNGIAGRLEFVREEILFELMVKTETFKDKVNTNTIKSKVIDSKKFDVGIKRVNIGCGHIQPEGYINVDAREIPGVDIISSASELPFENDLLDEIYCSHLLEHFTELELKRVILPHWWSKLNAEGILRIIVPDAQSMMNAYMNGEMNFDDLRKVTYGAQDYGGDFHYTMFTVNSLKKLLVNAGFSPVELIEDNRINGLCREMELIAYKNQ